VTEHFDAVDVIRTKRDGGRLEPGTDTGHEFRIPGDRELLSPSRITIASHVNVVSVRGISAPSQKMNRRRAHAKA